MRFNFHWCLAVLLCFTLSYSHAQEEKDITSLIEDAKGLKDKIKDPFKITGGISMMGGYNYITGIPRRLDPYIYQVNANVNVSTFGINTPLSFNYSNERTVYNYDLPAIKLPRYTFVGMSPTYKWATLHVGDRSMTFSPYTLSGHSFRGIGTELKPGKFYFGAMYGRLQRAQAEDLNSLQSLDPAFKRMGWGFKVGYDTGEDHIFVMLFRGWDDRNSIPPIENTPEITPADNTTLSIQGKKKLSEVISLSVDYARSAFTRDQNTAEIQNDGIFKTIFGLFTPRASSGYFNAIKSTLDFKVKFGTIGLSHEWVDPGYRTLGALFFNNDFENWTVTTTTNLFQKKVALNADVGVQRNNLQGLESNTSRRFVGSLNAAILLGEKANLNVSYSNFRNTNKLRAVSLPFIQVDSIVLSQINQNASVAASYIGGEEKNSIFTVMFGYNQSNSIQNDEVQQDQTTKNYIANVSHSYIFTEKKLAITSSLLATQGKVPLLDIFSFSPTLGIKMPLLKESLNTMTSFSYVLVYTNQDFTHSIINWQLGADYAFFKKHSLGFTMNLINRKANDTPSLENTGFTEVIGRLNYKWSF